MDLTHSSRFYIPSSIICYYTITHNSKQMIQITDTECSVCDCQFDLESEGGIQGVFGILPVAFCPTCYAGCVDMVQQFEEIE